MGVKQSAREYLVNVAIAAASGSEMVNILSCFPFPNPAFFAASRVACLASSVLFDELIGNFNGKLKD